MEPFYLARQPIYDRNLRVAAYELLFRGTPTEDARFVDGDLATSAVFSGSVLDIGLERLVGNHAAFINATRAFLSGEQALPDLHERVVLEVLENIDPDPELVAQLQTLKRAGYRIALDDFVYRPALQPLLALADYVKLDVLALAPAELAQHVQLLRGYDVQLVAEKVECYEMLARCRELGFDLYQGYFFCRPQLVCAQPVQADRMAVMRLIARLQDPKTEFEELEQAVSCNPVLAYQLLKYINSAHCGMRGQITSIRQALLLVGLNMIRSWATLLLMSRMADDKPEELIAMALIRARMCELLGRRDRSYSGDQYFTVGLLSVLDALLDRPLAEAITGLPLAPEVRDALACRSGPLGQTLDVVLHYERGRSDPQLAAGVAYATPAYVQAVAWSLDATQALPRAS